MCGILGSVNVPFGNVILNTIAHRGPDDSGIEQFRVGGNDVHFGHRRLSIIDLSMAGHQPMNSPCMDYSIIFNGEVYNHSELRNKLPDNTLFRGHSDTETLLHYLMKFGIEGLKDFQGIFAIAFLNKKEKKLLLARDPFGVKPLYYLQDHNKFIFSSEIRPIQALSPAGSLNKEALGTLLRLRFTPSPDTLHGAIDKLQPGHYLEIDLAAQDLVVSRQSFLDRTRQTATIVSSPEVTQYGQKLEKAVTSQLLADVDLGILLSGGIDSAVIAALAKRNYSGNLKAFTVGFEGDFSEDEIQNAAETADVLGLEHHYKKISFNDFIGTVRECSRIVEEPLATTSIIPMYFLSELASKHVKVVLSGQGADEPLGGYVKYKSELIRNKIPGFLHNPILSLVKLSNVKNEKILRGAKALGNKNEIDRFLSVYEIFSEQEIEKLISVRDRRSYERLDYFYQLLNCKSKLTSVERMMALDTRMSLADDLLTYTDKITMHFSLECRVPMLDIELVKFIEELPVELKLNLTEGKIIHKRFARSILPEKIINRKKLGFQSPTKNWFKKEIETIRGILLKKGTPFSGIFTLAAVEEILRQHQQGFNKEKQIFLLLTIFFWLESMEEMQSLPN